MRRDVQGLRALAVVAVLLDHVLSWPAGGFVGVDVFFVVSGFLITGHLLRVLDRPPHLVLVDFYRKRVRRIAPAALLVLAVGVAAAWVVYRPARFGSVLQDAVWAACSAANLHFAAIGTDYFDAGGPVSPFQHTWSLAVEEQFYLVQPVALILIGLLTRRTLRRRLAIGLWIGALTVASFGWALHESATSPTTAYFSTTARAWELGAGALLAVVAPALTRLPAVLRPVVGWTGLLWIVLGLAAVRSGDGFPAPGALLPVAGTVLVIAAGTGGAFRDGGVLTNRVAVRIGDLSYVLYLWHFPVLVLLTDLLPPGPVRVVVVLGLTVVLSIATHVLVEEPIRRSRLLEARPRRTTHVGGPRRRRRPVGGFAIGALAGFVAACSLLSAAATAQQRTVGAVTAAVRAPAGAPASAPPRAPAPAHPLPTLQAQLRVALAATSWPDLTPDVADIGPAARVPEWVRTGCLPVTPEKLHRCTWAEPGATRTVAVVGDSIALSWVPTIRSALEPAGWRVVALVKGSCPAAEVAVFDSGRTPGYTPGCTAHQRWEEEQVRRLRPDLVIASSSSGTLSRLADGAGGAEAKAEWLTGQQRFYAAIATAARRIVVLDPPPRGEPMQQCDTRFSAPKDCLRRPSEQLRDLVTASAAAVGEVGGVRVDTSAWFCVADRCPAFAGTTPVLADDQHLTGAMSARLGPVLGDALRRAGVLEPVAAG